jgi:hypothetical protein
VRSIEEKILVGSLLDEGLNDCEISRRTGIPRATVRDWRRKPARKIARRPIGCPACGHAEHDPEALPAADYAYLLGLYLGDGCISPHRRGVFHLRVTLDVRYPLIIEECRQAVAAVIGKRPGLTSQVGCVAVSSWSKQWPCLFPQHGPGRKHERKIALVDWQQRIVDEHPRALLRGLIHSDGWRGTNRVTVRGKQYAYPRYQFCNVSEDIKRIFCDACDALGIEWRRMNAKNISVARRASVARLDEFVGPKR